MFLDTYIYIPYDDESGGGKKRKKAKAEPEMTIEYTDTLDDTMKDWSITIFVCDHLLKASTCFRRRLQKAAEISKDGTAMLHKKSDMIQTKLSKTHWFYKFQCFVTTQRGILVAYPIAM